MRDITQKTLGELLSDENEIIRRNAISILKQLQKNVEENYSARIEDDEASQDPGHCKT